MLLEQLIEAQHQFTAIAGSECDAYECHPETRSLLLLECRAERLESAKDLKVSGVRLIGNPDCPKNRFYPAEDAV